MDSHDEQAIAPGVRLPAGALQFRFDRSGGPGGQHVNKLNTKATLTVDMAHLADALPAGVVARLKRLGGRYLADEDERLVIESQTHRSQIANRKACLAKLRDLIVRARAAPKRRKPTRPTRGSVERRLQHKKERGQIKAERKRRFE